MTARDYRETIFLPQTDFPMRAGLPALEPKILEHWGDLYHALRRARQAAGAPLYVYHDGPPYANGPIHMGTALNKLLKDFVVRSRFALGYDVQFTPGWDCHGLPIEWKIEEEFRSKGRRKEDVDKAEFRGRCREYAGYWLGEQRGQFKRLGVIGDWDNRYATMDFGSEAKIVAEFHKLVASGQVYRGSKPVTWSPVERTALAEAEVEYHDHVSPTIWVKFPIRQGGEGAVVIWTTTPWTIPANRAVSYNPRIAYGLYEVVALQADLPFAPWAAPGDKLVMADALAEAVLGEAKVATWTRLADVDPANLVLAHPLASLDPGYGFEVPMLAGDHVTDDAGTGFVHTAPSHGADDYNVWIASGRRDIPEMIDEDSAYYPHVPLFAGLKVLETEGKKAGKFGPANTAVMEKLIEAGNLLARGRLEHSYPHSWRSKAPVLFRNTAQWFVALDEPIHTEVHGGRTLREVALAAIDATRFFPERGRNRIRSMVENRPDWLLSRQRAWGSPLAMFVEKASGKPLVDAAVNQRIVETIAAEGADAWFTRPAGDFLGNLDPGDFEKVDDILDVWFDSGSTHALVLEGRPDSRWPADLYLEGSDQHRGWFQSSLLESCATRGRAPFGSIVTHGFTLDEKGEKMSKSLGNTIDPLDVIRQSGAEIIRMWAALSDYMEDQRVGPTILQTTTDAYRKLRNTVRYLLGALAGFSDEERLPLDQMPSLERYILHRVAELDATVRDAYDVFAFADVVRPVLEFCSNDLSALYFDVRRDVLYCDQPTSVRRRACRTVMDIVFDRLTIWLAPIAPFTMEEAWMMLRPDAGYNGLRVLPHADPAWRDDALAARWAKIETVTRVVTGALEVERREKRIGAALEAAPVVHIADPDLLVAFDGLDAAEIFRTSQARLAAGEGPAGAFRLEGVAGVAVEPLRAEGRKCARSWRILPEVGSDPRYPDLSLRDAEAVAAWDAAA